MLRLNSTSMYVASANVIMIKQPCGLVLARFQVR